MAESSADASSGNASSSNNERHLLIVWCHPRSCSTALERGLSQHSKVRSPTLHEPFMAPWYYGVPGERGSNRACPENAEETYAKVLDAMRAAVADGEYATDPERSWTVMKDMSYGIVRQYGEGEGSEEVRLMPEVKELLLHERVHNLVLVRNPVKAVPSLLKMVQNSPDVGWDEFEEVEVGIEHLKIMYDELTEAGATVPVLASEDLVANPHAALAAVCEMIPGFDFEEGMLSWESATVEEFQTWGSWHQHVQESTGFGIPTHDAVAADSKDATDTSATGAASSDAPPAEAKAAKPLAPELQEAIDRAMPFRDALYAVRVDTGNA